MQVARAFLWEYRRRHQLALVVLAVYLLTFLALQATVIGPEYKVRLNPPNGFAFFLILPGTAMLFYLMGAFTYGLSGDIAARESIYPKRMLTLPITTRALVGWPMFFGGVTAAFVYLVIAVFFRLAGSEYPLPWVWPAMLCALYIAWMQALTWMPYGITGVRVVVAVLWLLVVDVIVITAFELAVPERVMVALLAPQLVMAYFVAWLAVARARRGVVPDWSVVWRGPVDMARSLFRRRRAFRSPASAQFWFEWHRSGRALPSMVAIVVPAELTILFLPGNNTRTPGFAVATFALLLPLVLAFFSGTAFGTPTAFTATRPVSDTALIGAKLKSTLLSTIISWLIVLTAIPAAEIWSGASVPVMKELQPMIEAVGLDHAIVFAIFVVAVLMLSTWKMLVQNLCISLSGNPWLIKSTVLIGLVGLMLGGPGLDYFFRNTPTRLAVWHELPLIAMTLVSLKFAAGAFVITRLYSRRVLSDRALIGGAAAWLAGVVLIYGVLSWFLTDVMTPPYLKASVAILLMPLARLSAAPLALAWSRHR